MWPEDPIKQIGRVMLWSLVLLLGYAVYLVASDKYEARGDGGTNHPVNKEVELDMKSLSVNHEVWGRLFPSRPLLPFCGEGVDKGILGTKCIDSKEFESSALCVVDGATPFGIDLQTGSTICISSELHFSGQKLICGAYGLRVKSYNKSTNVLVCSGIVNAEKDHA